MDNGPLHDSLSQGAIAACSSGHGSTFGSGLAEMEWGNACIKVFGSHYEGFTSDPGKAYILALAAKADASHLCKDCGPLSTRATDLLNRLQHELPAQRISELTKESKHLICDVFPDECIGEALTFMVGLMFWTGMGAIALLILPKIILLFRN